MSLENIGIIGSLIIGLGGLIFSIINSNKQKKNDKKMLLLQTQINQDNKIFEDKYNTIREISCDFRKFASIAEKLLAAFPCIAEGFGNYSLDYLRSEVKKLSDYNESLDLRISASRIYLGDGIYNEAMQIMDMFKEIKYLITEIVDNNCWLTEPVEDENYEIVGEKSKLPDIVDLKDKINSHIIKFDKLFKKEMDEKK